MTDYSKPIGETITETAKRPGVNILTIIPVFAIIPEGERPETNEPEDDDWVCGIHPVIACTTFDGPLGVLRPYL